MVIQQNLLASNANRQLGIVKNNISKSTEKLSSGYKINRAADDASGLSISEKMRKQIRGLSQAAENIQDGISLCQVADGALNETIDILQRMNELSIQSANGTNSSNDRKDIQLEISQLISEIDRIASTTKFNEIYPLLGEKDTLSKTNAISSNTYRWVLPNTLKEATVKFGNSLDGSGNYQSGSVNGKKIIGSQIVQATFIYDETVAGKRMLIGDRYYIGLGSSNADEKIRYIGDGNDIYGLTLKQLKIDDEGRIYYDSRQNCRAYLIMGPKCILDTTVLKPIGDSINYILADKEKISNSNNSNGKSFQTSVWIQSTDETHKGLSISLVNATMRGLFSDSNISVLSESSCNETIDKVNEALKKVSGHRSYFGAVQNRLEHAYNINQNIIENTQFAESQIRDTDMASEMVSYSNNTILAQAGQSMLAQANQSNQGVLSLIA